MHIQQLYTPCLSEAAYYIESNGEAAIIDPMRDVDVYIQLAKSRRAVIKYIFETHFHADFISGHIDLSKLTGAPIIYGPGAKTNFKSHIATDGELFNLGDITLEVLHTPGHTIESSCYLLRDKNNQPNAIFTGDTLFVGDVGRPDLSSGDLSSEELAGILFETIQNKILPLEGSITVYPAHGPGSSCGKNLGSNTSSTIADEKINNYALQPQSKEEFIKAVTSGLSAAPKYFPINAHINQQGYAAIDKVLERGTQSLSLKIFKERINEDVILLDTRNASVFTEGFIPGSIFIGLEGRFAEWAGSLLPFDKPILLITTAGMEEETVIRLSRVGFEKMEGYLKGGFDSWKKAGEKIDLIIDVEADELVMDIPHDPNLMVVDVRKESEFLEGHLKDALNLPLSDMTDIVELAQFEDNQNLYVHCGGGYRSVIAASLLKRQGVHNLRNVIGGWDKIKEQQKANIIKEASIQNS
jgi:glyoxylase-like metal-dependent hydrolase (beta-lactamase superfamily II)/rhodanese-related sulfurtransferase